MTRGAEMKTTQRNAVTVTGQAHGQPMMFAHGYGCDQNMWRYRRRRPSTTPTGSSSSTTSANGRVRPVRVRRRALFHSRRLRRRHSRDHATSYDLRDVIFVGHSVSAMIGVLAAIREPERFAKLVLIGPSPRYIDDGDYVGGFGRERHRRDARVAGQQLPRLVQRDGAGDHGQSGPAGAGRRADQQLLPHRPGDRQASSPA